MQYAPFCDILYTEIRQKGGAVLDALKLLIADDNEDFRQALADALQGAYYVRTCRTGREALTLLHSYRPDVLVLNLLLP